MEKIRRVETVVFGGATHRASGSGPSRWVLTDTPGRKLTMVELWYQKTNSGVPTLSLSSQEIVTLSPRLTCFSLEPSIEALGWVTLSQDEIVLIPVVVAAWHWYSPWSLACTPLICSVHSFPPGLCSTVNLSSAVKVIRPFVRIR